MSKLKAVADDKFSVAQIAKFAIDGVESIEWKMVERSGELYTFSDLYIFSMKRKHDKRLSDIKGNDGIWIRVIFEGGLG